MSYKVFVLGYRSFVVPSEIAEQKAVRGYDQCSPTVDSTRRQSTRCFLLQIESRSDPEDISEYRDFSHRTHPQTLTSVSLSPTYSKTYPRTSWTDD